MNDHTDAPGTGPQDSELLTRGKQKRAQLMGQDFVDRAFAGDPDAFGADFQRFLTEYAWGAVWGRGGLTDRERHMVTLGILAALGRDRELEGHLRATPNSGVSERDLSDVLHQVAIYAGVPAGLNGFNIAGRVLAERKAAPQVQTPDKGTPEGPARD
ncbi:carboxymuconolactone decarboxylase family protein [Deinococcus depolymerans]|uniref:4-carboxymuconolactone decarboxylase n=1 Tax=Deinococcus depolymerans TaxID=392408 RepID=A0ABN1BJ74_9DEIO